MCERFATPVIAGLVCQDITAVHMQQIVNAAPTPGEGNRVQGMISALVAAGIDGGYLTNPRLKQVHWRAGDRPLPPPQVSVAGESLLFVDPAEIPAATDVARLGQALGAGRRGHPDELMPITAAYSGLRWGELAALTVDQVSPVARVITVDRKVVEIAGHLYLEAPKNRKRRQTIYPRATPAGYPLAEKIAARLGQARRSSPRSWVSSARSPTVACSIGASSSGSVAQAASTPAWRLHHMTQRRCPSQVTRTRAGGSVEGTARACERSARLPRHVHASRQPWAGPPRMPVGCCNNGKRRAGARRFPWRIVISVAGTESAGRVWRGWRWGP